MTFGKRKSSKESPIKTPPLRLPGQSLHEEYQERFNSEVYSAVVMILVVALFAVWEWVRYLLDSKPSPVLMTLIAVGCILYFVRRARAQRPLLRNIALGIEGERVVGQALEELRPLGYRVLHDVPGNKFNIDHVLIGPEGVFVIETKTRSKSTEGEGHVRYDGNEVFVDGFKPDRDPIAQARAGADYISGLIEADTGKKPPTRGVVLFPGWFVEKQPKGVAVWVLNPKVLPAFIQYEDTRLDEDAIRAAARAIEKHVRSGGN